MSRLLALLLLAALWWLPGQASAGCTVNPNDQWHKICTTQGEAYAAWTNSQLPVAYYDLFCAPAYRPTHSGGPWHNAGAKQYDWTWQCANATPTSASSKWARSSYSTVCPVGTNPTTDGTCEVPCAERSDVNPNMPDGQAGDVICKGDCEFMVYGVLDGFASAQPTGDSCAWLIPECVTGEEALNVNGLAVCRPIDTDDDGIPDNDDDFPGDPNESTDTDGDGIGDNGDHKPEDPTDGKDEDDEGGDEGDNVSTGGGDCNTPPNSTGDGILTQIAFQAWKTRCAIEGAKAADGSVKVSGNGTGGAIAIAGGGGGDDSNAGMFDDLKNGGPGEPDIDPGSVWGDGGDFTPDEAGFGFTRTCPAPPTITLAGMTRTLDTVALCDLAEMIGALVLLMAAAHAFFALAKG